MNGSPNRAYDLPRLSAEAMMVKELLTTCKAIAYTSDYLPPRPLSSQSYRYRNIGGVQTVCPILLHNRVDVRMQITSRTLIPFEQHNKTAANPAYIC